MSRRSHAAMRPEGTKLHKRSAEASRVYRGRDSPKVLTEEVEGWLRRAKKGVATGSRDKDGC